MIAIANFFNYYRMGVPNRAVKSKAIHAFLYPICLAAAAGNNSDIWRMGGKCIYGLSKSDK